MRIPSDFAEELVDKPRLARETDLGLGTVFERFSIYGWLESVAQRYPILTVLEGPWDGVAGIPGIHSIPLAKRGCSVAVALERPVDVALARRAWAAQGCLARGRFVCVGEVPLPFPSHSFDLVWNFNRLPFVDSRSLVAEMARLTRRYVALVVPNRRNYGFPARRLYHRRTRLPWPYGDTGVMDPVTVRELLEPVGLRPLQVQWLDVPWWPDVLDPRAWLRTMIPGMGRLLLRDRRDGYRWEPDGLPYFGSVGHVELRERVHRLGWLERLLPTWLQGPFAHHFVVLAAREDLDA